MTSYRNDETVVRRVEFAVRAGSDIGTVNKVEAIAFQDWRRRTGSTIGSISGAPDDWCTVEVTDDEIVFAFTVDHEPQAAARAVKLARAALGDLARLLALRQGHGPNGVLNEDDLALVHHALDGAGIG